MKDILNDIKEKTEQKPLGQKISYILTYYCISYANHFFGTCLIVIFAIMRLIRKPNLLIMVNQQIDIADNQMTDEFAKIQQMDPKS